MAALRIHCCWDCSCILRSTTGVLQEQKSTYTTPTTKPPVATTGFPKVGPWFPKVGPLGSQHGLTTKGATKVGLWCLTTVVYLEVGKGAPLCPKRG